MKNLRLEEGIDSELEKVASGAAKSSLVSRNVTILGRRTSVRLEPEMWAALNDISCREGCSVHDICMLVYVRKNEETSFTAAIRVFLMLYFRAASNEQGHEDAGHGDFDAMMRRARVPEEHRHFFRSGKGKGRPRKVFGNNDNQVN